MSIFNFMQGMTLSDHGGLRAALAAVLTGAALLTFFGGCGDRRNAGEENEGGRAADSADVRKIAGYDLASDPDAVIPLPSMLREVSGIAITPDGRLFAHNDERAAVFEIDRTSGEVIKQFALGERRLREDVEDITVAGEDFFLVNSNGSILAFSEGKNKQNIDYTPHQTGLNAANDIEGICHDPETRTLLLACKGDPGNGAPGVRAVYAFDLGAMTLTRPPRFQIDLGDLRDRFGVKEFMPSGIARHPRTGHFFLISSVGNSLAELSPGGDVVALSGLPKRHHEQPEGITFDDAGTLFIANEGKRRGSIAVYREKGR